MDIHCALCGNNTGYDEEILKESTININGCDVVMCADCEDELLIKLALRRDIIIELDDEYRIKEVIRCP